MSDVLQSFIVMSGLGLVVYGIWLIYPPVAIIICGLIMTIMGGMWSLKD